MVEFAIIDKYTQTLCTLYGARPISLLCARSPLGLRLETSCVSRSLFQSVFFFFDLVSMFSFHYNAMSVERMKRRQSEEGICLSYCLRGMRNVSLLVTAALSPVSFSPSSILVQSAPALGRQPPTFLISNHPCESRCKKPSTTTSTQAISWSTTTTIIKLSWRGGCSSAGTPRPSRDHPTTPRLSP